MGAVLVTRPGADQSRPSPRPTPRPNHDPANAPDRSRFRRPSFSQALALPDPAQPGQVVAAAGSAIVTGAKLGRILGRSAWRIAKQVPGVIAVEQQAQRLR